MFYYYAINFSIIFYILILYIFSYAYILLLLMLIYFILIIIFIFIITSADFYIYYALLYILCALIVFFLNFIYYLFTFCYVLLKNYQALLILSIFFFDVFFILLESSNSVYDVYKILHENLKKNNCSKSLQMCLIRLLS